MKARTKDKTYTLGRKEGFKAGLKDALNLLSSRVQDLYEVKADWWHCVDCQRWVHPDLSWCPDCSPGFYKTRAKEPK